MNFFDRTAFELKYHPQNIDVFVVVNTINLFENPLVTLSIYTKIQILVLHSTPMFLRVHIINSPTIS